MRAYRTEKAQPPNKRVNGHLAHIDLGEAERSKSIRIAPDAKVNAERRE
jgi:hypothetical protein